MLERVTGSRRRDAERDRETTRDGDAVRDHPRVRRETAAPAARGHAAERRARDEYGGINWGAAFFGWLVAVGVAALLVALASAAGAAIGLTNVSEQEASSSAETIGIVGAALLIAFLALSYYAGGYVAGRMSRFDGGRQGIGVWVIGLVVTIALAIAGVALGAEYNLLQSLNLPRIPVDQGSLTGGGAITLVAIVLGTLLAAFLGGKAGRHYHRKVDRAFTV